MYARRIILPLVFIFAACGGDDYGDRMAREHAGETPDATPMTAGAPDGISGRTVVYTAGEGRTATGYLAEPAGATNAPGVVVIHEWWGLNDNIRAMADRLAGEGYAALAVDLYGGSAAETPADARTMMQQAMEDPEAAKANLVGAYHFLSDSLAAPRVGSIGWCFGGGMSLQAALALPSDLDAAVIYYGRVTDDKDVLAPLQVPILGLFGADDGGIPVEGVRAFGAALSDLGKDADVHVYEGAGHAFANPSGSAYQAEAAEDAWAKTLGFLAKHLSGS